MIYYSIIMCNFFPFDTFIKKKKKLILVFGRHDEFVLYTNKIETTISSQIAWLLKPRRSTTADLKISVKSKVQYKSKSIADFFFYDFCEYFDQPNVNNNKNLKIRYGSIAAFLLGPVFDA